MDFPGNTNFKLHGNTISLMTGTPISQKDSELVAIQQYESRVSFKSKVPGTGADAHALIKGLSPGEADRILFSTDINAAPQSQQWRNDLHNFAVSMNSSRDTKAEDWYRVRFVITCDKKMNAKTLERKKQEIMNQVNDFLAPLNLQLDESFFVLQSHNPELLPEQHRHEFAGLFPGPDSSDSG